MKPVIRDALIIFILTAIGGFIIGVCKASLGINDANYLIAIGLSNIFFTIVGFTISAVIVKKSRFEHLFKVAITVWVLGAVNIILGYANLFQWACSAIVILISMGIGGGLSYIFVSKSAEINE